MMLTSAQGLELIKSYEGFMPAPYLCAGGKLTIGWGHLVREGEVFVQPMTQEAADELLKKDLELAENAVLRLTPRKLSQGQFDALVSFTYNLGTAAYQRSTVRQCVIVGYDDMVPTQMERWNRAGGLVRVGLTKRRKAEAALYMMEAAG